MIFDNTAMFSKRKQRENIILFSTGSGIKVEHYISYLYILISYLSAYVLLLLSKAAITVDRACLVFVKVTW